MAFRRRTVTMDYEVERSPDSSPDPLALSLNENTARSTRKQSPRKPLVSTSPSKQNRRSSMSECDFSSPSKAMVLNTPRMGGASPWRIKVTVQAEPGSGEENDSSPSVKRVTKTHTTTVPLKDPDATSPVKRGRGRPRKSDIGVVGRPKRSGTPVKRAARSKSRHKSPGPVDSSAADVDTDVPPKKKRGRPRKSIQPVAAESTIIQQEQEDQMDDLHTATTATGESIDSPTQEEYETSAPPQPSSFTVQDVDTVQQLELDNQAHVEATPALPLNKRNQKLVFESGQPVKRTPQRTELGKRLKARKGTPHAKTVATALAISDEDLDNDSDVLTPGSDEEDAQLHEPTEPSITIDAATLERENSPAGPPSHSKHASPTFPIDRITPVAIHISEADDEDDVQDLTYAFDEGATRMPDDTTVLDSENFSMISVDSLPSSGGLTSPPKPEESHIMYPQIGSELDHPPSEHLSSNTPPTQAQKICKLPTSAHSSDSLRVDDEPTRPALRRYVTPVIDSSIATAPPAIEQPQPTTAKSETPGLGRVVTAGVALQGVLDPSRLTPGPTQKVLDEERDRLDDLFHGFSEGTRKELQAGLRLGEQLAQNQSNDPSPSVSDQTKAKPHRPSKQGVFKTERKFRQPRLLTPEDQDDYVNLPVTQAEPTDVQYPALNVAEQQSALLSPERSEDEMSWRVDTPPVATGNTERMSMLDVAVDQNPIEERTVPPVTVATPELTQKEDYSDIWQEEASRSDSPEAKDTSMQDIFEPGVLAPARGKLPRTWRRKSGNHFQYSDEAESPQESDEHQKPAKTDAVEIIENGPSDDEDEDTPSEASDDTGVFFQSNLPNIFSKRHSQELKQKKADKLDLTLLMNEGQSLVPESSPPVLPKKSSSATKNNPFLDTPPKFNGYLSSPKKSSPLRQELRGLDFSSQSPSQLRDESSLPLLQSSPFHTQVEGMTTLSIASDQRQLQMEMGDVTASSIRRLRHEADEYLDNYEPQERSLNEIEEVTEPSHTWHRNTTVLSSSPPQMKQLSPVRKRVPLFGTPDNPRLVLDQRPELKQTRNSEPHVEQANSQPAQQQSLSTEDSQTRPTGLLTRMTSTLWSAVAKPGAATTSATAPEPHPILAKLTPLPKIEPWTKTHYKTLDKLYNVQYRHETLFSPTANPSTPLSQTNAHLLQKFLAATKKPYVGAKFSAWGYEMDMSEELVVLCSVFMELMSLENIAEYERIKGREIEMGDCAPGRTGDAIQAEEVVRRLATVILGEEVRRDEKRGVRIDRSVGLEIEWPQ